MEICIVRRDSPVATASGETAYQIMIRTRYGYNHVFPGALFTLDEARATCEKNGFNIVAVGDFWQCLSHE